MNSKETDDAPLLNSPQEPTSSTGTLFLILTGCLLTGCLLVFLFAPILKARTADHKVIEKKSSQPVEVCPTIVSTRTQPKPPFLFSSKIQLINDKSNSKKNLKQIGLALYNYNATFRVLPPGGTQTKEGKPYHSWQSSILPFLGSGSAVLFNKINFKEPWNTKQNYELFHQEVPYYLNPWITATRAPDGAALSHFVGNSLLISKDGSIGLSEITDGKSQTISALETGNNFKVWGDPTSIDEPINIMGPDKINSFPEGNNALMSDGSARFLSKDIDPAILKALSTPNGGEAIDDF